MSNTTNDLQKNTLPTASEIDSIFERVERAKQEWEATVDSLPELVCVVDARGCVVRANRTIETWQLGDVKAIQGFSLHTLLHPGCLGLYCSLDRYLRRALAAVNHDPIDQLEVYDTFLNRHLLVRVQPVTGHHPNLPITAVIVI